MTEEQIQQPAAPAQSAPAAPQAPEKKSNVWLWIIGGCLMIFLLIGVGIVAIGWWGVHKVKKEIRENGPKLEQFQKDAEKWQKDAEEMEKQARKMQKNLPALPDVPADDTVEDTFDGQSVN